MGAGPHVERAALLPLRKTFRLYANLRPVKVFPGMEESSPLKNDRVRGADLVIIRELTGGLYYGKPKKRWTTKAGRKAVDTMLYTEREVDRIMRVAFELARGRSKKVTSVDKANVLQVGRMWREIAEEVAKERDNLEEGNTYICAGCGYAARDFQPVACPVCKTDSVKCV